LRKLFAKPLAIKKALACEGLFVCVLCNPDLRLMLLSMTRCLSKNGVAACAGGRGCGGLFSKRGRLYSCGRKNDTACCRKLFSLRGGLSFPDKWIAGLVQDPSLALLAGDFAIHEGLDDLLASQGAALALACDEDHFIGFVSRFEDLNVLRCLPCLRSTLQRVETSSQFTTSRARYSP